MANSTDNVYVNIIANTQAAMKNMADLAKQVLGTYLSWKTFKAVIVDSFKEYMKAEDAQTRLGAAIRITGQQATASVRSLAAYAKELQGVTNYEEEATMAAMGVLMQLGNLTEQGVKKALPLLQDFASFWGMDLVQAAELFGKTLGSDTNALSRYGIELGKNLTSDQKLVSILGQMQTGMGGFAKEMAATTSGQLKNMALQVDELKESFGGLLASIASSDWGKAALEHVNGLFDALNWKMGGWKILLVDTTKMSRQQLIEYNTELNKTKEFWEKTAAESKGKGILRQDEYENAIAQLARISATMATVNRQLQKMPVGTAPVGAPKLTTGVSTTSPVVAELTEEQKLALELIDMYVELRRQAALYQKEMLLQKNQDFSVASTKGGKRALATRGIGRREEEEVEKEIEAVKKLSEEWQKYSDLIVTISASLGEAFVTGDWTAAIKSMTTALLDFIAKEAIAAGLKQILAGDIPFGIALLALGGITMGVSAGIRAGGETGPGLPRMAAGGVVTKPTLALIGESGPEAVVPLGRGGGGTTIIVQGSIWQTEDLARAVADRMGRW